MINNKRTIAVYFNSIGFVVILICFGVLFFLLPKKTISESEKRNLCKFPAFSSKSFFNGTYIDSIDLYFADNFPFRENFVNLSQFIKEKRGISTDNIGYYKVNFDNYLAGKDSIDKKNQHKKDSIAPYDSIIAKPGEVANNNGIFIYKGRAFPGFGGTEAMAKAYALIINRFKEAAGADVNVYCVVVPTAAEFYLPDNYKKYTGSEKQNIQVIYNNLSGDITGVDAYSELNIHKHEYIYFHSDHHWTGLGAYYTYIAFCNAAAIAPVSPEQMERVVKKTFLGTLYYQTLDSRLKSNPDTLIYDKVTGKHKVTVLNHQTFDTLRFNSVYFEYAEGGNSYGVFLGSDWPWMRVETGLKNSKRALVIKNSYGNAFVPYLTANYEKLFIIDYRYYNDNILKIIYKEGINDLIIITPAVFANSTWHNYRLNFIMTVGGKPVKPIMKNRITKDSLN